MWGPKRCTFTWRFWVVLWWAVDLSRLYSSCDRWSIGCSLIIQKPLYISKIMHLTLFSTSQLDINTGICAGISLSFFLLALQSLNLMVLNLMGPVLPVQHSFLNLCPSLLYRREQTQMQDLNMCVFTHRAFSCWVCSSFLSHHMDLWKPHVTIFMLFCIFPSEGATDTWFPLLPSLALSDRVRGHCHLLILNSCLHWYSIHPPYILRCPLLLTLKNFSKCSVLPEQGCPIEDFFFYK